MLEPEERTLLFDSLKPPAGYQLDHALITSYTLDLTAVLAVPMAITFDTWQAEGEEPPHPIAILDAVRSCIDRVTVVSQAGLIGIPRAQHKLFALVEDAVRSVAPPEGGIFHPKVWILRFEPESPDEPASYRLLVASRNLTFDRSWDLALVLEGQLCDEPVEASEPVAAFAASVATRIAASLRPLDTAREAKLKAIAGELARVSWWSPPGLRLEAFHAIGIEGEQPSPIRDWRGPMLVISPFLGASFLARLPIERGDGSVLVSNQAELDTIPSPIRSRFSEVYVLSGLADPIEDDEPGSLLHGLHAKVVLTDPGDGSRPRMVVGSPNASTTAFTRGIEFCAELSGPKASFGIEPLVGPEGSVRSLLDTYIPAEDSPEVADQRQAERLAEEAIRDIAVGNARFVAEPDPAGKWTLVLGQQGSASKGVELRAWPMTLNEGRAQDLTSGDHRWEGLTTTQLTAFLAISATATYGSAREEKRAAILLPLEGAPVDRSRQIVREVLDSPSRLLRYLQLLLSHLDSDATASDRLLSDLSSEQTSTAGGSVADLELPLFEGMMRALDRDPARLDRIASLVDDLAGGEGEYELPAGFEEIWRPIAEALTRTSGSRA
jgi:hypothetical protein